jgi:hypothetical protein
MKISTKETDEIHEDGMEEGKEGQTAVNKTNEASQKSTDWHGDMQMRKSFHDHESQESEEKKRSSNERSKEGMS